MPYWLFSAKHSIVVVDCFDWQFFRVSFAKMSLRHWLSFEWNGSHRAAEPSLVPLQLVIDRVLASFETKWVSSNKRFSMTVFERKTGTVTAFEVLLNLFSKRILTRILDELSWHWIVRFSGHNWNADVNNNRRPLWKWFKQKCLANLHSNRESDF